MQCAYPFLSPHCKFEPSRHRMQAQPNWPTGDPFWKHDTSCDCPITGSGLTTDYTPCTLFKDPFQGCCSCHFQLSPISRVSFCHLDSYSLHSGQCWRSSVAKLSACRHWWSANYLLIIVCWLHGNSNLLLLISLSLVKQIHCNHCFNLPDHYYLGDSRSSCLIGCWRDRFYIIERSPSWQVSW